MRWKAFLALLAIALHAPGPLRAGAAPQLVELCTAHGVVMVQLDAEGGPPASPAALEHCSVCAFHGAVGSPVQALPAPPAADTSVLRSAPATFAPTRTAARPRAPPLAS